MGTLRLSIYRYLLLVGFWLTCFSSWAGTITGTVKSATNEPIPGAMVLIQGSNTGAITDIEGVFFIKDLIPGAYTLEVSYTGYKQIIQAVSVSAGTTKVNFKLQESVSELGEVVVSGKSETTRISESPIQVASIDISSLQSESSDVITVLDRTAGVRVRQSGGLGSRASIQLNGLTGQAVRLYLDGVPLELYGGSIAINNIPVNTVERVDVYKGVMPIDVGTDALAGGVNVISRQNGHDYLDASYQVGSFNTHVASVNGSKKLGKHFVLSFSSFYNYSDNNYRMWATQRTPDFKEEEVEIERFHSGHQSYMVLGSIGLVDVKWADKLSYGVSFNNRSDERQHGARIGNKAVGEAMVERDAMVQFVRYQKRFWDNKLSLDYFGNFSMANDFVNDSTTNVYDWYGNITGTNAQGMEILSRPSLRDGKTTSQAHRLNLAYRFSPNHKLKLSSYYSNQKVVGNDPLAPKVDDVDPNSIPSDLMRSISGISYEAKWLNSKLETILFGKYYYYDQSTADFRQTGGGSVFEYTKSGNDTGLGLGIKYAFTENLFLRASYEQALRIPNQYEVFGNFITIAPNFNLEPEESKNLNLGGFYKHNFSSNQFVSLDVSWFLRDQSDLIRLQAGRNENDPAKYINEAEADAKGVELSLKSEPLKNLELGFNLTLQDVVKDGEPDINNTNGVGNPIPNIPSTFYNISARYNFISPFSKNHNITSFGYYTFVDEFDLIFQGDTKNEENIIPTQRQLDLGISYELINSGLTFSFQVNNVMDEEVYDFYRIPKPRRNFNVKLRYLLRKL